MNSNKPPTNEVPKGGAARKLGPRSEALLKNSSSYHSINTKERKLNEDQQLELMELIAKFGNFNEINKHFISKYQFALSSPLIYQYKRAPKWQPVIKKLREKYTSGVDEVAGMHKRVRLERADNIYELAMNKGDLDAALRANKDLREEVTDKHSVGNIVLNQFNQFNNMSDEELMQRREELMKKVKSAEVITDGSQ